MKEFVLSQNFLIGVLIYFLVISFYSVMLTCSDKRIAVKGSRRVPEKKLFGAALLWGALAMYITMRTIRHKTLHKRFMIGLPAIIILQTAAVVFAVIKMFDIM